METTIVLLGYMLGVILGIMEKKMETTFSIIGLYILG